MDRRYNWAFIIKEIQETLFISETGLGEMFNVSQQAVSSWIHGTRYPSPRMVQNLLGLAGKHSISVKHEYLGNELEAVLKLVKTKDSYRLLKLYGRMNETSRKKLLKYMEKIANS